MNPVTVKGSILPSKTLRRLFLSCRLPFRKRVSTGRSALRNIIVLRYPVSPLFLALRKSHSKLHCWLAAHNRRCFYQFALYGKKYLPLKASFISYSWCFWNIVAAVRMPYTRILIVLNIDWRILIHVAYMLSSIRIYNQMHLLCFLMKKLQAMLVLLR